MNKYTMSVTFQNECVCLWERVVLVSVLIQCTSFLGSDRVKKKKTPCFWNSVLAQEFPVHCTPPGICLIAWSERLGVMMNFSYTLKGQICQHDDVYWN